MKQTYSKPNFLNEIVESFEERTTDLQNPLNLLSSKHCFIIAYTKSGKKIKYELTDKGYCRVNYEYLDLVPSITTGMTYLSKIRTVGEITSDFCRIATRKKHDNQTHSCQHATRDFFNYYGASAKSILRSVELKLYSEISEKKHAQKFLGFDSVHDLVFNESQGEVKHIDKSEIKRRQEIWNFKQIYHTENMCNFGIHRGTHTVSKAQKYKADLEQAFKSPFFIRLYEGHEKKSGQTES